MWANWTGNVKWGLPLSSSCMLRFGFFVAWLLASLVGWFLPSTLDLTLPG
jgi:hypothetical protein